MSRPGNTSRAIFRFSKVAERGNTAFYDRRDHHIGVSHGRVRERILTFAHAYRVAVVLALAFILASPVKLARDLRISDGRVPISEPTYARTIRRH